MSYSPKTYFGKCSAVVAVFMLVNAGTADNRTEEIRDRQGHLLGVMRTLRDGTVEARDRLNRYRGKYIPRNRETRDRHNQLVSTGNTLAALLLCGDER